MHFLKIKQIIIEINDFVCCVATYSTFPSRRIIAEDGGLIRRREKVSVINLWAEIVAKGRGTSSRWG